MTIIRKLKSFEGRQRFVEDGYHWALFKLYRMGIPGRVRRMRKKPRIDVLFVLTELGAWKTENLYEAMLKHPRFNPILGVARSTEDTNSFYPLVEYLKQKDYAYKNLHEVSIQRISPDIIFYQKPYDSVYPASLIPIRHLNSLFCFSDYGMHTSTKRWTTNKPLHLLAWQMYYENEMTAATGRRLISLKSDNIVVTGMPIMDQMMQPRETFSDPWLPMEGRKRIIYAPHHSISDMSLDGMDMGTFLENGEYVLSLARQYADTTQWAFKPHPLLHSKLCQVWGRERTDAYYQAWESMPHSQVVLGKYQDLFAYSDAMIHDCNSFRIEYIYWNRPVLYLVKNEHITDDQSDFSLTADACHYHASRQEDIRQFVDDLIAGNDPLSERRQEFREHQLTPPHGKTACQNIINAILGEAEYHQ